MPKLYNPKVIIKNNKSLINSLDNGFSFRNPRFNNKIPVTKINNSQSGDRIKNLLVRVNKGKKIKKNKNPSAITKTTHHTQQSNSIAKSLGFKDAVDFDNFIKNVNPNKLNAAETKKISILFKHLLKTAKRNPKSIAKLAIAGGSVTALIVFLKKFQNDYSGCFRYRKKNKFFMNKDDNDNNNDDDDDDVKYKFAGSTWCNTNGTTKTETKNIKLLLIQLLKTINFAFMKKNHSRQKTVLKWDLLFFAIEIYHQFCPKK